MKGVGYVLLSDYHLLQSKRDTDRTDTRRKGKETEADFQSVLEAEQKKDGSANQSMNPSCRVFQNRDDPKTFHLILPELLNESKTSVRKIEFRTD